jgi:nucleotide-binding universal stress UspA family protein
MTPQERGQAVIERVTANVAFNDISYDTEIVVNDDIEDAALATVGDYETVCVGATREGAVSQALFGSLPEMLSEQAPGTVVMAQSDTESPRSIREALIDRLRRV